MAYAVQVSSGAERELAHLPSEIQARIAKALRKLSENPRQGAGVKKLRGQPDGYRLRVGDYRVLYEVHDKRRLVFVVKLGHRRDVYRYL